MKMNGKFVILIPDEIMEMMGWKNGDIIKVPFHDFQSEKEPNAETKFSFAVRTAHSFNQYKLIRVPMHLIKYFPSTGEEFVLETNVGEIRTWMTSGTYFSKNLGIWYEKNGVIKDGDIVEFQIIEEKKRYRIGLIREGKRIA
jgi:hypothetical protein